MIQHHCAPFFSSCSLMTALFSPFFIDCRILRHFRIHRFLVCTADLRQKVQCHCHKLIRCRWNFNTFSSYASGSHCAIVVYLLISTDFLLKHHVDHPSSVASLEMFNAQFLGNSYSFQLKLWSHNAFCHLCICKVSRLFVETFLFVHDKAYRTHCFPTAKICFSFFRQS